MKENVAKGLIALVFAAAGAYFRELLGPVIVLGLVMFADYVSGLARAWIERKLSSRVGIIGIIKRLKRRLSQSALAAKMQTEGAVIDQDAISRIESGSRLVTDYELLVLTRIFGVSSDYLIGAEIRRED